MKRIDKEIQDRKITQSCRKCCIGCEKFKTAKEQKTMCEARKARGRIINRMVHRARKEKVGFKFD